MIIWSHSYWSCSGTLCVGVYRLISIKNEKSYSDSGNILTCCWNVVMLLRTASTNITLLPAAQRRKQKGATLLLTATFSCQEPELTPVWSDGGHSHSVSVLLMGGGDYNPHSLLPSCPVAARMGGWADWWGFSLWIQSTLRTWQHIAAPLIRSNSQSKQTAAADGRHISYTPLRQTLTSHSKERRQLNRTGSPNDDWSRLQSSAEHSYHRRPCLFHINPFNAEVWAE